MGFNRATWLPGRERHRTVPSRYQQLADFREKRARRGRDSAAARALEGTLISLAGLVGSSVEDPSGQTVGRLRDVVAHWTSATAYPAVTAIVVRAGKRDVLIGARVVDIAAPCSVRLRSSRVYARALALHPGDIELARDVLDQQVVDAGGMQVVRPADVYLATVDGRTELVGIEVGARALLRRMGPKRLRGRVRPERVIDWAEIRSFAPARADGVRSRGRRPELAGHAGTALSLDAVAGEIRRLRPSDVESALRAAQHDEGEDSP